MADRNRTLGGALRALDAEELADVFLNRPHAAALAGARRVDIAALSGALALPQGIHRAIAALNEFHRNLLIVATWFGGDIHLRELREQTPGVPRNQLEAGASGLARRALAFPRQVGKAWALWVPPCVGQVVESFGEPGDRAMPYLETLTVDMLADIARHLGVSWDKRPRKADLVTAVGDAMSDPEAVAGAVASLSPEAWGALDSLRSRGGCEEWSELKRAGLASHTDEYGFDHPRLRSGAPSAIAQLIQRGLAVASRYTAGQPYHGVLVPGEVEVALRGGLLFSEWHTQPPAPASVAPAGPAERSPEQIVAEAGLLLDEWSAHPAPRLKDGGLGTRELKKAAKRTGLEERVVRFLYALMAEAGLLGQNNEVVTTGPEAAAWATKTPPQRWDVLFQMWRTSLLWNESDNDLIAEMKPPFVDHSQVREAVMAALAEIPSGSAIDVASLGAAAHWMHPHSLHCADCTANFAERILEGLALLGTATRPPCVALLEPARSALRDPGWTERSDGSLGFSAPVEHCTIQADLTVIVPGSPSSELGAGLAGFAELKASSPARVYRITEASLQRALDAGTTAEQIISLLQRHADKGVPQAVTYLIEDVARRHGRVRIGEAGLFLRADEPDLLAAILSDRKIAKLGPKLLAPTVAVVSGVTLPSLLKTLRSAGHMPVAEDGGLEIGSRQTGAIFRFAGAASDPTISGDQARELAAAVLEGRSPESDETASGAVAERGPMLDLLRRATTMDKLVEMGYLTDQGLEVVRFAPIVLQREQVFGWSERNLRRPAAFHLDHIAWVRPLDGDLDDDALLEDG